MQKSFVKWKSLSHVRLCNSMVCGLPGSIVHGILQARILERVALCFSRGSSQPRDWTHVSCIAGRFFLPAELPGKPRRALYMWTKEKSWVINSQDKETMSLKNYCMWTFFSSDSRGQTSLSSLNCLRACTLKKYQPSLKRPANNWMVQGENQRGTHCPVDPYFGRNSAGEIPSPSFSFPPFMAGWWPGPKLHFTLVPKALSQGLLHWLAQWLDMQHPETDKDIPGSAHCFALVPLLCSGTARTSLKKDKKDRRRVCLTSQDISVLFCYPHPLYIHSLFQGTGLWQADCCAGTLCPTSFIHSVTEPQNKRKMLVKLGQMRTLSPNFPQISMCG